MPTATINRWLGILALLLCCAIVFVWIPLDVETGIIEKVRRQVRLGDAFAPTLAALLIGLGGVLLLLQQQIRNPKNSDSSDNVKPTSSTNSGSVSTNGSIAKKPGQSVRLLQRSDFLHALIILLLASLSILLMRYVGPMVLYLFDVEAEYRLLRDTAPWKYIGFTVGAIFMIVTLIAYTEKRIKPVHFFVAIVVVLLLIVFYDLPFDDLLLPPNGDV